METNGDEGSVDGPYFLEKTYLPDESDDGYQYEEVTTEDDISLIGGDEDLEAVVKALRNRVEETDMIAQNAHSPKQPLTYLPEAVDDFLRNFLAVMGMTKTLDCFQTEWFETQQRGLLKLGQVQYVPDVYSHNQLLDNELKNVQKERDSYKQAAVTAAETLVKLEKERDFHRLQHKQVVQEKNRLIEDIKRLKKHYASYEPALKQLTEKYQTSLKQQMLVGIERDRALEQAHNLEITLRKPNISETKHDTQRRKNDKSQQTTERKTKSQHEDKCSILAKELSCKHPKDSHLPSSGQMNSRVDLLKTLRAPEPKGQCLSLTTSVKAHSMPISCLALHPSKMIVASASDDHHWRLWGLPAGEKIMTGVGHTDWLSGCSFHPGGGCLATTGGDTTVKIWDFTKACCVLTLEGHTHATWGCSFHSCGDFVASCSMDNTAKMWDLNSERCRSTLRGHVDSVNSVHFLPYANTLLTSSADKTLSLWDVRASVCAQTFYGHQHSCNHAIFNSLGDTVASCDSYGVVKLWDVRKVSAMLTLDMGPHPCNQVAFSPSSRILAIASNDASVKVIDLASSQQTNLVGHEDAVQSVLFDHKGLMLMSAGSDGTILIWS